MYLARVFPPLSVVPPHNTYPVPGYTHNIWIGIVGLPNHIMAQIEETKAAQRFEPRWIDERHKVVVEVQCSKSDKASKGRTMKTVDFVVTEAKLN